MKCPCPKIRKKGGKTAGHGKKSLDFTLTEAAFGGGNLLVEGLLHGFRGRGLCAFSQSIKLVNAVIAGNLFMWALCGLPLGKEESI